MFSHVFSGLLEEKKSRDIDSKSSSQRISALSNRMSPKPHPRVHEHTSSQSHCIQEGRFLPALTEATRTSLLMSLERGKKPHDPILGTFFQIKRFVQLSKSSVHLRSWLTSEFTKLPPHTSASKLQIANFSDFTSKAGASNQHRPNSVQAKASLSHFLHPRPWKI